METAASLKALGWTDSLDREFAPFRVKGLTPGRVAVEWKGQYRLLTGQGEFPAEVMGKLLYRAASPADLPKVGDWVAAAIRPNDTLALIHEVLPRRTKLSRKVAGKRTEEQIIAANIDRVFVVQGLDDNFNLRRLERYLVMIYEGEMQPVVVLNKADLCEDSGMRVDLVKEIAKETPVVLTSAVTNDGIEMLKGFLKEGLTFAFVGSSGVGKSSLINKVFGKEVMKVGEVREADSKGRHTTTQRQLFLLPEGGLLIDTPGMRELQLWGTEEGLAAEFDDIHLRAADCRFKNCTHVQENGCAVRAAVEQGALPEERYRNYLKLQKELDFFSGARNQRALQQRKQKSKAAQRAYRKFKQERNRTDE